MTFKKNWLSIVIWIPFAIAICGVYGMALYQALAQIPAIAKYYMEISIILLSFALAAGAFIGIRKLPGIKTMQKSLLIEALVFAVLLGAGVFLRCYFLNKGGEEAAYFEAAKVTGSAVTTIAHGAQYFYVLLLRGLFLLFGNHFTAGIVLQIVLQSMAAIIWYLAIRKMTGAVAALVFMTGVMFMPQSVEGGLLYSPKYLYLLLAGILLWCLAGILKREYMQKPLKWYSYIVTWLVGAGIGLLTYMDVTGLVFLVPLLALGCVSSNTNTEEITRKEKAIRVSTQLISALAGFGIAFALFLYLDAWQSGAALTDVFSVWSTLFSYKGLQSIPAVFLYEPAQWIHVGILFVLVVSVPAFFIRKKDEIQLIWAFLLVSAGIIHAGGFFAQGMNGDALFLFLTAAFTGAGLQTLLHKEIPVEVLPQTEIAVQEKEQTIAEAESEPQQEIKPKFIENPLPLPKKHVKQSMGYKIEILPEQMKYDIEISDTDDFDISD